MCKILQIAPSTYYDRRAITRGSLASNPKKPFGRGAGEPRYGSNRLRTWGDPVRPKPDLAMPLSMVLHELTTNAVRHGALSNDSGHVDVVLRADAGWLTRDWVENGGPAAKPGEPNGFGLVLITGQIEHQLGGTVQMVFDPVGLKASLRIPT